MTLVDAAGAEPSPQPTVRVRLLVSYLGAGFAGFARNPGVRTVAGVLTEALEKVLRHPVRLTCAGRTDAGVHAWGQVVSFDAREDVDLATLQRAVNHLLGPAVVVREAAVVPTSFDARHSAVARRYRYTIVNRVVPDPFLAATTWHVPAPLDLAALRLGADPFLGEHDFSAFCRRPKVPAGVSFSMTRRVLDARWLDLGEGVLRFDIEATAFCQQMVRSIVGLLVEVGSGKRRAGDVRGIIASRDRARSAPPAPPEGLVLWEVVYA
ncbi:MAG: tRNA pseudouridine(38-40) synthase TruA [Actinomycetota bacterium]|nr:tRNA pseudouridine(38-40) synthase TruA [Actinomycetota bacterium]